MSDESKATPKFGRCDNCGNRQNLMPHDPLGMICGACLAQSKHAEKVAELVEKGRKIEMRQVAKAREVLRQYDKLQADLIAEQQKSASAYLRAIEAEQALRDAKPVAKKFQITSVLRDFVYKDGIHTPTVIVSFNRDDWDSRDDFAESLYAAPTAVQQPVAWRISIGDSPDWSFTTDESQADFYGQQSGLKYVKEPLFLCAPGSHEKTRDWQVMYEEAQGKLNNAIERMDRARHILTDGNPRPDCMWAMLDTADLNAAPQQSEPVREAELTELLKLLREQPCNSVRLQDICLTCWAMTTPWEECTKETT